MGLVRFRHYSVHSLRNSKMTENFINEKGINNICEIMLAFKLLGRPHRYFPIRHAKKKVVIIDSCILELTKKDFEKYIGGEWSDLNIGDKKIVVDNLLLSSLLYYLDDVVLNKLKDEYQELYSMADWISIPHMFFTKINKESYLSVHVDFIKELGLLERIKRWFGCA